MLKAAACPIAVVLPLVFLVSSTRGDFVLEKGRPVTIVLADSATPAEQTAAEELKTYLGKMVAAPCAITPETQAVTPAVYVGPTAMARQAGIDCEELGKEAWILRTSGDNLIVAGGRPRGVLYGAYDLLERLGVTWADVETEFVPAIDRKAVDWNVRTQPAIMNRCIYPGVGLSAKTVRFLVRNKMNAQIYIPRNWAAVNLTVRREDATRFTRIQAKTGRTNGLPCTRTDSESDRRRARGRRSSV